MKTEEIIEHTLLNIIPLLQSEGNWEPHAQKELDAYITLHFPDGDIQFDAEVKQEVRENILRTIQDLNRTYPNFLLVAYRIYPKYRLLFQEMGINYLEANGNAFIRKNEKLILIDKFPTIKDKREETNRAFTKTGLRVLFQLLVDNKNLNTNQRELAEQAGVALGNIPLVLKGLKTAGLLVNKNKFGYQWTNKEEAIEQWINGYRTNLKPTLFQGKYRLPKDKNWREINLPNEKTRWGGEPGADLLTNYLRPEKFILFTDLRKNEFIKDTRLMPDPNGEIEVYETFWETRNEKEGCAPPLLVYADLIINGDKRSIETAEIIYDRFIQEL
ncbi:type IV toxin-antitoxin system AbiEi family antitoxin [Belliella kenyensis]|uniref:Type IV toxin-antitoxin system AbiEi family antitoxin n=1 Tax=Belliella kenyensis TaxID=1472724 RepID=A0ABV8EQ17_9BACT|nr:type IV toxin-antitoxin system AbiEi family antitoxin [Belliella kenyensis]MCH7400853.1 type IV toxin-antitoxin system AbiEi family antitoxin [Belliella kenyensis]MDN3601860.1 type IV toxin-antitoxin system AbiEi family antitoxin [Belliella kenyensis]